MTQKDDELQPGSKLHLGLWIFYQQERRARWGEEKEGDIFKRCRTTASTRSSRDWEQSCRFTEK